MSHYLFFIFVFLFGSYSQYSDQSKNTTSIIQLEKTSPASSSILNEKKDYHVKIDLEKINDSSYYLTVKMMVLKGAYYVSPYTKKNFKGKFKLILNPNNKMNVDPYLLSIPDSQAQSIINGSLDWIRVDTLYKQLFHVNQQEDFTATGFIQFVIEPRCTFEKIPFSIVKKNGLIQVISEGC